MIPPVARITFTLPLITQAEQIILLAAGPAKRTLVDALVDDRARAAWRYPAAQVFARRETLLFYAATEGRA